MPLDHFRKKTINSDYKWLNKGIERDAGLAVIFSVLALLPRAPHAKRYGEYLNKDKNVIIKSVLLKEVVYAGIRYPTN
jgi:hypothetical protein